MHRLHVRNNISVHFPELLFVSYPFEAPKFFSGLVLILAVLMLRAHHSVRVGAWLCVVLSGGGGGGRGVTVRVREREGVGVLR